jgi:hypothetical protein
MKFDLDIMFGIIIAMLIVLYTIQAKESKQLQTQIDELRIVVNQKFLPAMILEAPTIRENYGSNN